MEPHPPSNRMLHATSPDLVTWTLHGPAARGWGTGRLRRLRDRRLRHHGARGPLVHGPPGQALSVRQPALRTGRLRRPLSLEQVARRRLVHLHTRTRAGRGGRNRACWSARAPSSSEHEGRYLMYYSSENRWGDSCIALATSKDMVHWEDEGPFHHRPKNREPAPGTFWDSSVPRVVEHGGRYYLFVMFFWGLQYAVGDDPLPLRALAGPRALARGLDLHRRRGPLVHHPRLSALWQAVHHGQVSGASQGSLHRGPCVERRRPGARGPGKRAGVSRRGARR